jgi:hypothetical protein
MTAREGSLADGAAAGRIELEVLSSHPTAEAAPWGRRTSVAVIALAMLLGAGLAVHRGGGSSPSGTLGTSSETTSYARSPATLSEASLVALVNSRCPQVRRLRLGVDIETLLFVEIAPCPRGGQGSPVTSGSQDVETVRFARIVGIPPLFGSQNNGWIAVRCPDQACTRPELRPSFNDITSARIH